MRKAAQGSLFKFSRINRLVDKNDFQSVFAKPYKNAYRYLLALYRPNPLSLARLGIIINKRHVRRAVDRNQLRRIIRESFRHQKEALKELDIIILIRSECIPFQDKNQLRDDIDKLWLQLLASSKKR